jgi:hypothetical protein
VDGMIEIARPQFTYLLAWRFDIVGVPSRPAEWP